MIFELGLLFATYIGSKLYDSAKEEAQAASQKEPEQEPEKETGKNVETQTKEDLEKQQLRYLKGSLISMGCFAAKSLIPGAGPLGLAAYLYSTIPYMRNVEKSLLRDKKVNVDVLFFTADALTFGMKNYFTAALGLSMIHHGRYMVTKARDDSAKMVAHLYREMPRSVWKVVDGVEVEIPLGDVKAGDLIIVTSGSVIPVDGVLLDGFAQVDQQALTGEAQPAEKGKGDPVFANTIVIAGRLVIRVDRSGADTTSAQISEMLLNSVSFKSGVQLKGERWADQMALPMLVSAVAVLPIVGPVSTAVFINSHIGARILLFGPLTTLRHISEASKLGVLVKDGRALEQLCDVDTILFDKTGTLTTDQPEVKRVRAINQYTVREILACAATAERKLNHPIAKAILKKAEEEQVTPYDIEDSKYTMGYGISVMVDGKNIRVGSVSFFHQEGINIPTDVIEMQQASHALGNTFILVGIDQQIEGTLELQPQIRPEAHEMIAQLRAFGIDHVAIVSGDDQAPTRKLAEDLGMDEYFYNVLPENKAKIVEALQAKGRVVCFIGDGINDSIALKKANVSMSIAGATSIAKDMAEILFMDGSLKHLADVMELSKRLEINLKRSLALCLVPSIVNLSGAFVFNFSILTALLVNNGFSAVGVSSLFYTKKKIAPRARHASPKDIVTVDPADNILHLTFPAESELLPCSNFKNEF
jgi:heavy metal translocating P-type ATPase